MYLEEQRYFTNISSHISDHLQKQIYKQGPVLLNLFFRITSHDRNTEKSSVKICITIFKALILRNLCHEFHWRELRKNLYNGHMTIIWSYGRNQCFITQKHILRSYDH